jgi:putative peptide zinc metalloprotease protein
MEDNGSSREADSLWAEGNGGAVPLLDPGTATAVAETVAPNGDEPRRTGAQRGDEPLTGSAADFSAERMLRPGAEPPTSGWRRLLLQATGGIVRLAPSAAELRHRELVARVKTPVRGCRKVAFISRKGGVGKTTTCRSQDTPSPRIAATG